MNWIHSSIPITDIPNIQPSDGVNRSNNPITLRTHYHHSNSSWTNNAAAAISGQATVWPIVSPIGRCGVHDTIFSRQSDRCQRPCADAHTHARSTLHIVERAADVIVCPATAKATAIIMGRWNGDGVVRMVRKLVCWGVDALPLPSVLRVDDASLRNCFHSWMEFSALSFW